ncbi:MAG: hypothetical protein V1778_01375 [bacterium]
MKNAAEESSHDKNVETDPRSAFLFPKHLTPGQRLKVGVLALLTVAASAILWMCLAVVLSLDFSHLAGSAVIWIGLGFLAFFFLIAFVAIVALLVHDRVIAWSILLLAILTHLIWFRFGWYTSISLVLLVIGFFSYDWQIKNEESLRIQFSVTKSMRYGLSMVIAMTLLAFSLTFYGHTVARQPLAGSSLNPISEMAGNTLNQAIALQMPDYDPKETVDDLLYRIMTAQVQKEVAGEATSHGVEVPTIDFSHPAATIDQLSTVDLSAVIEKLPQDIRAQVGDDPELLRTYIQDRGNALLEAEFFATRDKVLFDLGVTAQGTTPVGEVVKQLVVKQVNDLLGPYETFIPPLLALTVFFTLSIFIFLYAWLIKALAALIFVIIKKTGFVKIHLVDAEVEVATLNG